MMVRLSHHNKTGAMWVSFDVYAITSMSVIPRAANVTAVNGEKLETGIFPSILFANSA
jgi:hypothetical protein